MPDFDAETESGEEDYEFSEEDDLVSMIDLPHEIALKILSASAGHPGGYSSVQSIDKSFHQRLPSLELRLRRKL